MDNNNTQILNELQQYFATRTHEQVMKDMYGDSVDRLKTFDSDLWKDAIANQVEIGDEELFYADDSDPMKKYLPLFDCWSSIVDYKLPWQNVDESAFPIQFIIIEDAGKRVVMSVMVGQGAVCDILPIDKFKGWMEQCENKYVFDESKYITVDDMKIVFNEVIDEYEAKFKGAE